MLINNTEALKSWLIVILEPLCDADSSALARYVLALLKKDKPEPELKKVMIEQLDVFLAEETTPFVDNLFEAINSEEYLTSNPIMVKKEEPEPAIYTHEVFETKGIKPEPSYIKVEELETPTSSAYIEKIQTPPINETKTKENCNNHKFIETEELSIQESIVKLEPGAPVYTSLHIRSVSPPVGGAIANKENQPRENRRRRASLRSRTRSRSRSRSNERLSRRSRSRDRRINDREKNQRQFRNKSPSFDLRHERRRIGDRRRGGGIGAGPDQRPGGNIDNRKNRQTRSGSRSNSPSPSRNRVGSPSANRINRGSPERHHSQHEGEKRQRCRDFDEKGYCVRGETCPWDHGVNPVVFEGINNSALISMSLREYNPDAPDLWARSGPPGALVGGTPSSLVAGAAGTGINPFTGVPRPGNVLVGVGGPGGAGFPHIGAGVDKNPGGPGPLAAEYMRGAPAGGFRGAAPMIPFPFNPAAVTTPLQRELIPIPVVDAQGGIGGDVNAGLHQSKRRYELEDSVAIADGPPKRKLPINSRLGPRVSSLQNNCSLELRKVPRGLNTIAHLNNHFAKFGKIVNIQISYDGDPEAAIITFSTHAEANVAYRSTEAVLNNRFIKVFWHSSDSNASATNDNTVTASGRKNSQYHLNNIPAVPTPTSDSAKTSNTADASQSTTTSATNTTTTTTTTTAPTSTETTNASAQPVTATHSNLPSLRLKNNVPRGMPPVATNAILRKKQEEQAKAVVQLASRLRKRKQELLQNYVQQMKSALEIVERCEPNDPQRTKTLETIKVLQAAIDKLRKEMAAEQEQLQAQIQHQQPIKKTKEQQKKELLDIELELFAQQQEGNDTTAIQKRLEELQRSLGIQSVSSTSAPIHGLPTAKSTHFGGARVNPRIRPSYPDGPTRVDRRPKTIVVSGFTSDEADFVLGHFKHFGEITKHDMDKEIPQLILSYATRTNAETAVVRGKIFKDKRLQVTWAPVVTTTSVAADGKNDLLVDIKAVADEETSIATTILKTEKSIIEAELNTDTLPELRLEDEEEDDECEDRSWRR